MDFLREFRGETRPEAELGHDAGPAEPEWSPTTEKELDDADLAPIETARSPAVHAWAGSLPEGGPPASRLAGPPQGAAPPPRAGSPEDLDARWQSAAPPVDWWDSLAYTGSRRPPSGRRRTMVVAAIAVAVALAAGTVSVVVLRHRRPGYPSSWAPNVAPIARFVASDRGLAWKHPVKVEFLPAAKFVAEMTGPANSGDPGSQKDQQTVGMMRALGVVWGKVNLAQAGRVLTANDVIGAYEPKDHTVYVKGTGPLTPDVEVVLAHELTHALQDQYFDLAALKSGPADGEGAVTALIEGDAVRVEDDYVKTLSQRDQQVLAADEQSAYDQASAGNAAAGVPGFLSDEASFPYDFGPSLVDSLFEQGGNSLVDAAFRRPPSLDSEVIDPGSYQPGIPVPPVTLPPVPAGTEPVVASEPLGELAVAEALGYETGFGAAWAAVQGFANARIEAYQTGGRTCVTAAVVDADAAGAENLFTAFEKWASSIPGARASLNGLTVGIHSCDPGAGWRPGRTTDVYNDLATRSFWIGALVADGHLGAITATCVVDHLTQQVGIGKLSAAENATSDTDPSLTDVAGQLGPAGYACGVEPSQTVP